MRVGDDLVRIEEILRPQPVTGRTGADRTVEGEQPRLEFAQGIIADRTGELIGEHEFCSLRVVHVRYPRDTLAEAQRGFKGFGQALTQIRTHFEAIDDG